MKHFLNQKAKTLICTDNDNQVISVRGLDNEDGKYTVTKYLWHSDEDTLVYINHEEVALLRGTLDPRLISSDCQLVVQVEVSYERK